MHYAALFADPESRERLLEASRFATVGRLVASFAHQMSTPLAAMALRIESLESEADPPAAPARTRRYLRAMADETRRCQELLAALRSFGGPPDLRPTRIDLGDVCRKAALLVGDEAMRRQLSLALDVAADVPLVIGQPSRIGQVVLALLTNAIDASPREGRVALVARPGAGGAIVAVTDEGEGVPASPAVQLFSQFCTSRPADQGQGLAAARSIVEAHDGELTLEPAAPRGSRLVVRLPVSPLVGAAPGQ